MSSELQQDPESQAYASAESMPAARPRVRPVVPEDGPGIHAVLTRCLPDVVADRDRWLARWRWQYWDNPHREGRDAGYVLVGGERIVGHLGAVYMPLVLGDMRLTGVVGSDYAIHPAAADGGGVFAALELAQALFAGADGCLAMATTANDKTAAVFGRYGCRPVGWTKEFWRAPACVPQLVRSCRGAKSRLWRRALSGRVGTAVARAVGMGHDFMRRTPRLPLPCGCRLELTVPRLACDLGQLWHGIRTSAAAHARAGLAGFGPGLCVDRSQAFLDWRYGRHPERDAIRVLVLRDADNTALGAVVLFHERRSECNVVHVEDVMAMPDRPDVVKALLCAALRLAFRRSARYVVTSPGTRAMRGVLWELGFETRARNAPAAVVASSCGGDSELILPDPLDDHIEFWHGMMF